MCSAESTPDPNNGAVTVAGSTGTTTTNGPIKTVQETTNRNPNRRSNKPIMEKRRRARINNCLNELKSILLEAMRKDPARHSKLEKADILELTVSHLKALHRHQGQSAISPMTSSESTARFRAGFADCAAEVGRFLSSSKADGIDPQTSGRLLSHLADCLNSPALLGNSGGGNIDNRHCHSPSQHQQSATLSVPSNAHAPAFISLVPSRLSSGELAFVVPGFNSSNLRAAAASGPGHASVTTPALTAAMQMHHQPMLSPEVPLELTVSSSCSSSTSSSSLSPAYPIGGHSYHHGISQYAYMPSGQGQPLALVTPKREDPDMSCWRPWCSSQESWHK